MAVGRKAGPVVVALVLTLAGCGWTQLGADAGNTSANSSEVVIGPGNVAGLTASWSLPTTSAGWFGRLLVHGGLVVTSADRSIAGYSADTGATRWSVPPVEQPNQVLTSTQPLAIQSGPAGDVVLIGEGHTSLIGGPGGSWGYLRAVRASDGHVLWSQPVGNVLSARLIDGRLFVVAFTYNHGTDFDGTVVVDPATGDELFRIPGSRVVAGDPTTAFATVADGSPGLRAYPTAGCGTPSCLPAWSIPNVATFDGTVALAGGRVFVSSPTDGLKVFSSQQCAAPCAPLWSGGTALGYVAVSGSTVYVTGNSLSVGISGRLAAFAAAGCGATVCDPVWSSSTEDYYGPPAVANGLVYVSARGQPTEAFAAAGCGTGTCAPLWSSSDSLETPVVPVIADGRLYAGGASLQTYALP
jgi:outer membrane protein assembly factor BamB